MMNACEALSKFVDSLPTRIDEKEIQYLLELMRRGQKGVSTLV